MLLHSKLKKIILKIFSDKFVVSIIIISEIKVLMEAIYLISIR